MHLREDFERLEDEQLAPYAMRSRNTLGREYPIPPDEMRTEFQRDRDRIIHSTAFRKLEYKTQVYMIHFGDYYRTRLTHSMEVAQLARALARCLGLNVDLTEAIALVHDVGHTPFGHSGEMVLQRLLADQGGFEHNEQGLRVVEYLEERYPEIPGLNLTFEVREGVVKHDTAYDSPTVPTRFHPEWSPTLESQIADVADEIAYNNHDIDDALKMGLLEWEDLQEVAWLWEIIGDAAAELKSGRPKKFAVYAAIGSLIDMQVMDVLRATETRIAEHGIRTIEDVRGFHGKIVAFSAEMQARLDELKAFLMRRVYKHPRLVRMAHRAEFFIERMFNLYIEKPEMLPLKYQGRIEKDGLKRVVSDYISGMTDRYLLEEYRKAFEPYGPM